MLGYFLLGLGLVHFGSHFKLFNMQLLVTRWKIVTFFLTNVFSGFCYFSYFQSTVDALIALLIFQLRNGATALAVCFLIPRWAL